MGKMYENVKIRSLLVDEEGSPLVDEKDIERFEDSKRWNKIKKELKKNYGINCNTCPIQIYCRYLKVCQEVVKEEACLLILSFEFTVAGLLGDEMDEEVKHGEDV